MKIVFVAYNHHPQVQSPLEWIGKIQPLAGIMQALSQYADTYYAGRIGYTGQYQHEGVNYLFPYSQKDARFFQKRFHAVIAETKPDACIVLGLHFPIQLMELKKRMGRDCIILARHHADRPGGFLKRIVQRWADGYTDGYLFNSIGNAGEWLQAKIIRSSKKIFELPAGSTSMKRQDVAQSRSVTGMDGAPNFLWVGRLDENKDPFTVLQAFEKLLPEKPAAKLYMIYQQDQLLDRVKQIVANNPLLNKAVTLVGKIEYEQLPYWYSAADYYISSSYREGGSYALLEAMACGCVPIVTDIPSSIQSIGNTGLVFESGDADGLAVVLKLLDSAHQPEESIRVQQYFQQEHSPAATARKLYDIIRQLKPDRL
jgi:glycosyltransferase involved in cell wall biosynthesis